jgi:hypothetical protein
MATNVRKRNVWGTVVQLTRQPAEMGSLSGECHFLDREITALTSFSNKCGLQFIPYSSAELSAGPGSYAAPFFELEGSTPQLPTHLQYRYRGLQWSPPEIEQPIPRSLLHGGSLAGTQSLLQRSLSLHRNLAALRGCVRAIIYLKKQLRAMRKQEQEELQAFRKVPIHIRTTKEKLHLDEDVSATPEIHDTRIDNQHSYTAVSTPLDSGYPYLSDWEPYLSDSEEYDRMQHQSSRGIGLDNYPYE